MAKRSFSSVKYLMLAVPNRVLRQKSTLIAWCELVCGIVGDNNGAALHV